MELRVFAACHPNSLDGSRGWSDWKTHQLYCNIHSQATVTSRMVNMLRGSLKPTPQERGAAPLQVGAVNWLLSAGDFDAVWADRCECTCRRW